MFRALLGLWLLTGCGGLYSHAGAGGGNGGLGPPDCMRTFSDAISVPVPAGADAFQDIQALVFGADHNLYVLSRSSDDKSYVDVLGSDLKLARTLGRGKLGPTRDLVVATNGTVYVAEDFVGTSTPPDVVRFDSTGMWLGMWPASGGSQDEAHSLAFDGEGLLNIGGLGRIHRYRLDGTFVDQYATFGKGPGKLLLPEGLTFDPVTGSMWVADVFQNFIEKYVPGNGVQQLQFGGRGAGDGKFDGNEPTGTTFYGPGRIAIDGEGKLYATDPFGSRVQKFAPNGAYLGQFSFGGSIQVGPIAINPANGILFVARGTAIDRVCPF